MTAIPFEPGTAILQEGYNAATHKLIEVRPATVVEDSDRALVLYFAAGSAYLSGDFMLGSRRYELTLEERVAVYLDPAPLTYVEYVSPRHVLSILPPGAMHAAWFFWDEGWNLTHRFVNLQAPTIRRDRSIEIVDYYLDIRIAADSSWEWKDVDEFEAMCDAGAFGDEQRAAIWAEARRCVTALEAGRWPFDGTWDGWRPAEAWPPPALDGWRATDWTHATPGARQE